MKIVFLTDIHVGNSKIYLDKLVHNLRTYVYPEIQNAQMLILGGDFFDSLLNLNSDAGIVALYIIDELIELSIKNNMYLRVLRGTFSHDRYQNRIFVDRAKEIPLFNDIPLIRIIDKIEVERFSPYKIDVLYCPDDQPDQDRTQAVLDMLEANHLEQVDYFCHHGYWDCLLKLGVEQNPSRYIEYERFSQKVRHYVLNGHIHSPGIYNKIISGGSFERFRHAEEEDKGFYVIDHDVEKQVATARFVRNKETVPFITINMASFSNPSDAIDYLQKKVNVVFAYYPEDARRIMHVRIVGDGSAVTATMKDMFPYACFTEKRVKEAEKEDSYRRDLVSDLPNITVSNLPELIYNNIHQKYPDITQERIKEILNGSDLD